MRADKFLTDVEAAAIANTNPKTFQKLARQWKEDATKEGGNTQDFGRVLRRHGK